MVVVLHGIQFTDVATKSKVARALACVMGPTSCQKPGYSSPFSDIN